MKLKFFFTIFLVLLVTGISLSAVHFHFFSEERLRLIELNLQQNATLIMDSDLTLTKKEFLQKGHGYIEKIIGDDKVNIIVAIYNLDGTLLYANENAVIFGTPKVISHRSLEWEDVEYRDYVVKYLTRESSHQKRIVRVGMILNQSLLRWRYLSQRLFVYAALILSIITVISFILTTILFRPVHILAQEVYAMAEKLGKGDTDDFRLIFRQTSSRYKDEFSALMDSMQKLAIKITESHNITKRWSALMAHELKTPLTILKNHIEGLSLQNLVVPEKFIEIDEEILRMEHIIQDFLEWASLENDSNRQEIHAVSFIKRTESVVQKLRASYPNKVIEFNRYSASDIKIFCNPIHFDQMLSNLITNAVKYGERDILIECTDDSLLVRDEGPGIPKEVIERIGTPFNHGKDKKGSGLGLAWVHTICQKYQWNLFISCEHGCEIVVSFPADTLGP